MLVIEDVEERILSALSHNILNIIDDKHIHLLIERKEVGELVPNIHSIHELSLESVCRNIQNHKFRIFLLDRNTDCLSEMGLAQTRTTKEEERIECSLSRCRRDALSCRESHLVALTYHEVLETIYRIELWIHLHTLDTRENKQNPLAVRTSRSSSKASSYALLP